MVFREEKLAYIAGLIDGEGSIGIFSKKMIPVISISNTSKIIVEECANIFNTNIWKHQPSNMKHKLRYNTMASSRKCLIVINILINYLILKYQNAKYIIEYYKTVSNNNLDNFKGISKSNFAKRKKLKEKTKNNNIIVQLPDKYKNNPTLFEYYLAGIIDGEGHIAIKKTQKKYYHPKIEISNTNKSLILLLSNYFNGSIVEDKRQSNHRSLCYCAAFSNKPSIVIAELVKDKIISKKDQIEILLEFYQTQKTKYGRGGIPIDVLNKREYFYNKLKGLHH